MHCYIAIDNQKLSIENVHHLLARALYEMCTARVLPDKLFAVFHPTVNIGNKPNSTVTILSRNLIV